MDINNLRNREKFKPTDNLQDMKGMKGRKWMGHKNGEHSKHETGKDIMIREYTEGMTGKKFSLVVRE